MNLYNEFYIGLYVIVGRCGICSFRVVYKR